MKKKEENNPNPNIIQKLYKTKSSIVAEQYEYNSTSRTNKKTSFNNAKPNIRRSNF